MAMTLDTSGEVKNPGFSWLFFAKDLRAEANLARFVGVEGGGSSADRVDDGEVGKGVLERGFSGMSADGAAVEEGGGQGRGSES